MTTCSRAAVAVLLAGCFALSVFAQDINLTGTVTDSATQAGIKGAIVKLKVAKLFDTTDANGAYTLTGNISAIRFNGSYSTQLVGTPHFRQSSLYLGVANNGEQVRIDVFDLLGRDVRSYVDAKLDRGNYQVNMFEPAFAGQLYFVKVNIGGKSTMLKMPFMGEKAQAAGQLIRKISGSGSAKVAADNDTLIIVASGYKTIRKGITSYTGTNNFVMPWYGHVGSIMFDMGSYSGAEYPAAVIVNDSDLTGATVPVRIKSRADTVGFTLILKKDPTTAGQYLDSIWFNINSSDSAKHMIMVQQAKDAMGDTIYAFYNEAAPAMQDTATVQWSGNAAEVNPGASMYGGLTVKMAINVSDPDVADTFVTVTIKSQPADSVVGIPLTLPMVPGSWGTFSGLLGVTTGPSSAANRTIKVTGKDVLHGEAIIIIYQDKTPMETRLGSICTWRPVIGSILLDSTDYHGTTSKMNVTLYDDDIAANTAVVTVKSKKDPTGFIDTLKYSGTGSGRVFSSDVGFSTTASNATTGVIGVLSAGDSVYVTYVDDTPDTVIVQGSAWHP
ncbi:MAG TPA: hypothetical protein VLX68_09955 [Chitinivibrionales bacterium]|nr:hypothetical protein [Chitinivibrionales bacterium]